jgi:uncharacterized glyoxalase superfamily protein PhnB
MNAPTLGYLVFPVAHVQQTVDFWVEAFGCTLKFVHESGEYAELDTGATTLGFVADTLMEKNGVPYRPNRAGSPPAGVSVSLVCADPAALLARAVKHGATSLKPVERKPWGQLSGYVSEVNGLLVELCSPVEH